MPLTLNQLAELSGRASEHVLAEEVEETGTPAEEILARLRERLAVMRDSVRRGLASDAPSVAGLVGKNAKTLWEAPDPLRDPLLKRVQAYAMAVNEENARMGRIVAAPTAGSAGTLPGALLGVADHLGIPDEELLMPLVLAGGVAKMIGRVIHIAGASGGCQAEIGSSAAMEPRSAPAPPWPRRPSPSFWAAPRRPAPTRRLWPCRTPWAWSVTPWGGSWRCLA